MQYKKRLGQHFLVDQNIIDKLIKHIKPLKSEMFLEIGPGDGALTKSIINKVNKLTLIEKDSDLIKNLYEITGVYPNTEIIHCDFLKYDLNRMTYPLRVIGNLPYNISTEIIFKMCSHQNTIDMHFMLQKEVVDRIVAEHNSKSFGRLSVMAQAYFNVKRLFNISENVFFPKPTVKSSFIRFTPKNNIFFNKKQEIIFFDLVKSAFEGRRKMIRKSLDAFLHKTDFDNLKIDYALRAENLSVNDYLRLSEYVEKN